MDYSIIDKKYNDGSYRISIQVSPSWDPVKGMMTGDIGDITGHGNTKEEAIENFKQRFEEFTSNITRINNDIQKMTDTDPIYPKLSDIDN